jgi:hypothetical protein
MKRGIVGLVGVIVLLVFRAGYAESGWTDFASVAELVPTSRHYYEVSLPVMENPSECKERTWFYKDYDSDGADIMYKTLLEGVRSEMRVRVYVTGKCNINGYAEFSSISIVPK